MNKSALKISPLCNVCIIFSYLTMQRTRGKFTPSSSFHAAMFSTRKSWMPSRCSVNIFFMNLLTQSEGHGASNNQVSPDCPSQTLRLPLPPRGSCAIRFEKPSSEGCHPHPREGLVCGLVETLSPSDTPGELFKPKRIERKEFKCKTASPLLSTLNKTPNYEEKRNRSGARASVSGNGRDAGTWCWAGCHRPRGGVLRDAVGRRRWGSAGARVWGAHA